MACNWLDFLRRNYTPLHSISLSGIFFGPNMFLFFSKNRKTFC
uniref:Uncharacterized protein n=1 Tax=Rhizophora mucronata TaxID=61149 RepID=A0A2P2P954_RHIMU